MAKEHHELAHKLLALSLQDGVVSDERVHAVLEVLRQNPPRHFRQLLKTYARLLRREISRGTLRMEYAGSVSEASLQALLEKFTQHYSRPLKLESIPNPALIAGVRAQIGDDVWDMSAAGRLGQIAQATR